MKNLNLSTNRPDDIVVGAGLAGLTAAFYLRRAGRQVTVLEKSARCGGVMRTVQEQGYLLELGPNTVQGTPDLTDLIEQLGLRDKLLVASEKTPRFIQKENQLFPVPMSPLAFLKSPLLSTTAKLRLLREPWISRREETREESLEEFSHRRLGREVSENLLAPFVSGVWAGSLSTLSANAAFPKLTQLEQAHGSLLRGAIKSKKSPAKSGIKGLLSFQRGLQTLVEAMGSDLGQALHIGTETQSVERTDQGWRVQSTAGTFESQRLWLAVPAFEAAKLLTSIAPVASRALSDISYAPLAALHLGFLKTSVHKAESGFGFLARPRDNSAILGCLWNSDIFPDRAAEGHVLMTVFMGGSVNPSILTKSDSQLVAHATDALSKIMRLDSPPSFQRVTRYEKAIPQYTTGIIETWKKLEQAERDLPGLTFLGNIRGGISVGDVVSNSRKRVSDVVAHL